MPSAVNALSHHGQHDALCHLPLLHYAFTVTSCLFLTPPHSLLPPPPRSTLYTIWVHLPPFYIIPSLFPLPRGYATATGGYLQRPVHLLCIATHSSPVVPLYFPGPTRVYHTAAWYVITTGPLSLSLGPTIRPVHCTSSRSTLTPRRGTSYTSQQAHHYLFTLLHPGPPYNHFLSFLLSSFIISQLSHLIPRTAPSLNFPRLLNILQLTLSMQVLQHHTDRHSLSSTSPSPPPLLLSSTQLHHAPVHHRPHLPLISPCSAHNCSTAVRTLHKAIGLTPAALVSFQGSRLLWATDISMQRHPYDVFPSFPHCSFTSAPSLPPRGPLVPPCGCASPPESSPCSGS